MKNLKKLKMIVLALLFVPSVAFYSCDDNDPEDGQAMDNQLFVTEASSSNSLEIAAGNLAINKGVNEEVRMYGHHMVEDHTAVGVEMKALATTKGWTVPTDLLEKHRTKLSSLEVATGEAFDREFALVMVSSHEEAVALFDRAGDSEEGVPDNDLRTFARQKLPGLETHLEEAEALLSALDN